MHRVWLAGLVAASFLVSIACNAAPQKDQPPTSSPQPRQEIFDQEVVEIYVDYAPNDAKTDAEKSEQRSSKKITGIRVEPDVAKIYFQWKSDRKDSLKPVQARWVVRGLQRDHILYVVPKEGAPEGIFPIPDDEYGGRRAYRIDGKNNSIRSGEVLQLPELVKEKGYLNPRRERAAASGDYYTFPWHYDVVVTDQQGNELYKIDPQIDISGHP
jgi:hypothetical protein